MKYKIFDVVILKDDNRAVVLSMQDKNRYFCEIVNENGETIDKRIITEDEIKKPYHLK